MTITVRISSKGSNGQIDYEGEIDGKPYCVQIDPAAAPHWYDSDLDDDQRSEVLEAIDAFISHDQRTRDQLMALKIWRDVFGELGIAIVRNEHGKAMGRRVWKSTSSPNLSIMAISIGSLLVKQPGTPERLQLYDRDEVLLYTVTLAELGRETRTYAKGERIDLGSVPLALFIN